MRDGLGDKNKGMREMRETDTVMEEINKRVRDERDRPNDRRGNKGMREMRYDTDEPGDKRDSQRNERDERPDDRKDR